MKNYILIFLVLFSFLTCKGHIENNDSKPFLEQKANYSEQKNDSASHKQVEEEILNKKKQKDSSIKEDAFCLFLKSKNVACIYEEKYDENHFLNEVYTIKNLNLDEVFKLIKGYEFDSDVIIDESITLKNIEIKREIPYYIQKVYRK